MPLRLSRNLIYRIGAVALIPVGIYNLIVWGGHPDSWWEQAYLKSLIGGIGSCILSVVLGILSFTQQDRHIVLCERRS